MSEEYYREKYLKYKQKLSNISGEGGTEIHPIFQFEDGIVLVMYVEKDEADSDILGLFDKNNAKPTTIESNKFKMFIKGKKNKNPQPAVYTYLAYTLDEHKKKAVKNKNESVKVEKGKHKKHVSPIEWNSVDKVRGYFTFEPTASRKSLSQGVVSIKDTMQTNLKELANNISNASVDTKNNEKLSQLYLEHVILEEALIILEKGKLLTQSVLITPLKYLFQNSYDEGSVFKKLSVDEDVPLFEKEKNEDIEKENKIREVVGKILGGTDNPTPSDQGTTDQAPQSPQADAPQQTTEPVKQINEKSIQKDIYMTLRNIYDAVKENYNDLGVANEKKSKVKFLVLNTNIPSTHILAPVHEYLGYEYKNVKCEILLRLTLEEIETGIKKLNGGNKNSGVRTYFW